MTEGRWHWVGEAPAKVNLRLEVLARERSGYHQIETIFQALELSDGVELLLGEGEGVSLDVRGVPEGALGAPDQNLVVRAARAYLAALSGGGGAVGGSLPGLQITLTKRIPHGAGLGGGSSDAATVLLGLQELGGQLGWPALSLEELLRIGGSLGADVPFFLSGASRALGWGRGDRLLPLEPLPPREVLLLLPRIRISTLWAYEVLAGWRARRGGEHAVAPARLRPIPTDWEGSAAEAHNDFAEALAPEVPELGEIRDLLLRGGARLALLSGSGSALFGVFDDPGAVETLVGTLPTRIPGLQLLRTRTRGSLYPPLPSG